MIFRNRHQQHIQYEKKSARRLKMTHSFVQFVSLVALSLFLGGSFAQKSKDVETEISERAPAPAPNDCSECWCQCKRLSFRDKYGRVHGNCQRLIVNVFD